MLQVTRAFASLIESGSSNRFRLLQWLQAAEAKPRFAVVHEFSTHNLLLRYWLASCGADPDRDVDTVVLPAEDVVNALADGGIAGFSVGAPWEQVAEQREAGRILIGTSTIWPFHPAKCLCVAERWAEANSELLHHLLCAVLKAQITCDLPEQAPRIASLLSDRSRLDLPQEACRTALPGGSGADLIRFHSREAWFPARAHALWFLGQMRRWGWLHEQFDLQALASQVYRPDLLASAIRSEGLYPAAGLPSLEGTAMLPMPNDDAFAPRRSRRWS